MKISEKEKERIVYSILKRMKGSRLEPEHLKRKRRLKLWHKIDTVYGNELRLRLLNEMQRDGILEPDPINKHLILSKRGNEMLKRGWIYYERYWYDADYVRKYTVIISIIALIVSTIGNETIWKAVKYIYGLILR
jgi:hypothetical protein